MLPRQCRRRGCTGSARRNSMRPWQRPGVVLTAANATEVPVPGVAGEGPSVLRAAPARPRGRGGAGAARKQRRYPAIVGPLARPSPDRRYSAILSKRHPARIPCRAPLADLPRTVREVGLTSRTGPPPAGNGAAVSPSPLSPVQRADPRRSQTSVPAIAGPERTAGRTATRREHAAPRPARRRPGGPDPPHGQQSRHPDVCPLTVGIGRTTLCLLVFSTGGHIPRGSAICVCRRSTEVRTWGGIGTNAARRPR